MVGFFGTAAVDQAAESGLDLVQSRYGWTDDEVYGLSLTRYLGLVERLAEHAASDAKQPYVTAAFIGWQTARALQPITEMVAGLGKVQVQKVPTFAEYLREMGLAE